MYWKQNFLGNTRIHAYYNMSKHEMPHLEKQNVTSFLVTGAGFEYFPLKWQM